MSQDTSSICCAALFAEQVQELLDRLAVTAGVRPHQPAGVVVDDDGQVSLSLADRDLIHPEALEPGEQVALGAAPRRLTRSQIQPTVRHAIRISCETAVLDVLTVSHATWSSKLRVNPESCLAHGTAATTTP